MSREHFGRRLCAGVAFAAIVIPASAHAQGGAGPEASALEEVVVTATRQTDTVNRVPLSITAVTSQAIEQQGLKDAQDLARTVPALSISSSNSTNGGPSISIRGIVSSAGTATTGIYLDDVALQRRALILSGSGGTLLPSLFDLARVEVLRGPQGTLYGGSSQGGTVRFIQTAPSVTTASVAARAETATTEHGSQSWEVGIAGGGPLVQDRLGFRASVWMRRDGGYIDHVSRFTGKTLEEDTNYQDHAAYRLALTWKPTAWSSITPAVFFSRDHYHDSDQYWTNIAAFQATNAQGVRTYGPFNMFGPYKTGFNTNIGDNFYAANAAREAPARQSRTSSLRVYSLTAEADVGGMNVKSITAYTEQRFRGEASNVYHTGASRYNAPFSSPLVANIAEIYNYFPQSDFGKTLSEEIRFSSINTSSPLQWVAGIYYNNTKAHNETTIFANFSDLNIAVRGAPIPGGNGIVFVTAQQVYETQLAGFAEANYLITPRLKATAGLRVSRNELKYVGFQGGALFGFAPGVVSKVIDGAAIENPTTPKLGLQYLLDGGSNLYVTAAEGFRAGGVNQVPAPSCAADIARLGFPVPLVYGPDTLWSYEAGAKIRTLGGRAQINASVFKIDWTDVQTRIALACGSAFAANAASATSKGADLQIEVRPIPALTASVAVAYTDARYTDEVRAGPGGNLLILANDPLPAPKWSASASVRYSVRLAGRDGYLRADYQYTGPYQSSTGPGTVTYTPDNFSREATHHVSARAGLMLDRLELAVFVNNLFNSQDSLSVVGPGGGPGRINCVDAACATFGRFSPMTWLTTFRPRTIGVSANFRY